MLFTKSVKWQMVTTFKNTFSIAKQYRSNYTYGDRINLYCYISGPNEKVSPPPVVEETMAVQESISLLFIPHCELGEDSQLLMNR